jgi:hypothetical protein
MAAYSKPEMRKWFAEQRRSIVMWLAVVPSRNTRKKHKTIALGLIATAVFALGPLGYEMLEGHPCGAWGWWIVALICAAYSFWQLTPIARWRRIVVIAVGVCVFGFYGQRSIYSETELNFFFVNPGVFSPAVGPSGSPGLIMLVNGQNTHRPIFNASVMMRDMEMIRIARIEEASNPTDAEELIKKSWYSKSYPEIDPTSPPDDIVWIPLNANTQEYEFNFTYRIAERSFQGMEEIRFVNVGKQITFANRLTATPDWQESVTVKNQSGEILMHCVDKKFPRDSRWVDGHPCFPGAHYEPLPRSLCQRCFGRGFEFSPATDNTE